MNICRYFIYLLFLSLCISCGLPSYSVVEPPVLVESDTVSVRFSAPANDSNISGYEIYYKIYPSTESDAIQADKDSFDVNNSAYVYEFGDTKPKNLGFSRLQYGTSKIGIPLISNNLSDSINLQPVDILEINFSSNQIVIAGTEIGEPGRLINDSIEPFSSSEIEGDFDDNGVSAGMPYSISFAAYSFVSGIIDTTYENSIPVFLGTVDMTN